MATKKTNSIDVDRGKVMRGVIQFLKERNCDLIEETDYGCIVSDKDNNMLRFVEVNLRNGDFGEDDVDAKKRKQMEKEAAIFLASEAAADIEPQSFTFDIISMLVLSDQRAMLRYHKNCLSAA